VRSRDVRPVCRQKKNENSFDNDTAELRRTLYLASLDELGDIRTSSRESCWMLLQVRPHQPKRSGSCFEITLDPQAADVGKAIEQRTRPQRARSIGGEDRRLVSWQ
jgi:hypothetical protein